MDGGDEKLFKSKGFRIWAKMFNTFPVRKGAKAIHVVNHAIEKVKGGSNLQWYPEGMRHKTPWVNKCNPGKLGSGMIAHATEANIIPVFLAGPEFAMPVGTIIRTGKRARSINMLVRYGKPVPMDDLRALPATRPTAPNTSSTWDVIDGSSTVVRNVLIARPPMITSAME